MTYLFKLKIIHRDLKLANIFITFPNKNFLENDELKSISLLHETFLIKIGDLGFSK